MSDLKVTNSGYLAGGDLEIRRTVTGLPAPTAAAWLTVKHHPAQPDAEARLQKRTTTADAPGTGQIVAPGGPGADGDLCFDLTSGDTAALGINRYVHDIQIRLTTGKVYTIEKGTIELTAGVTQTNA